MITATIIQDSTRKFMFWQKRATTFVLEYPRYIHAELMTHRVFSRNASSSRAIPVEFLIQQTIVNPVTPLHWGQNQPGMVADNEVDADTKRAANKKWRAAATSARRHARKLAQLGIHKQITNRVLEPFQHIRVVLTGTEFDNFFALRTDQAAQPEIRELANQMYILYRGSIPVPLKRGEWHLPFVDRERMNGKMYYFVEGKTVELLDAIRISASACAQTSYRKNDLSVEKAKTVYRRLVDAKPVHASPFEHPCQARLLPFIKSRNFKGFKQLRTMIPNDTVHMFKAAE